MTMLSKPRSRRTIDACAAGAAWAALAAMGATLALAAVAVALALSLAALALYCCALVLSAITRKRG